MAEINEQFGASRQQNRQAATQHKGRETGNRMPNKDQSLMHQSQQRQHRTNNNSIQDETVQRFQLDRDALSRMIREWNETRLDIFKLTPPDDKLLFEGNMRFYYREQDKSLTKCMKVKSTDTTEQVIAALTDKILGDMRMLTTPLYSLYEVHEGCEDVRLAGADRPLYVQLNWLKEDREGRFMLKNEQAPVAAKRLQGPSSVRNRTASGGDKPNGATFAEFVRRVSKRGKKKSHGNQQVSSSDGGSAIGKHNGIHDDRHRSREKAASVIDGGGEPNGVPRESDGSQLYKEIPESSFHRSISNPEAVMRRRRAQKLERKLQQFRNSAAGGQDTGGTLKIFGDSLNPSVPYKTLLLSVEETAETVVRLMLQKYSLEKKDPRNFCIVRTVVPRKLADRMEVEVGAGEDVPRSKSMHQIGLDEDKQLEVGITLNDYECPLRMQFEFEEKAHQRLEQQSSANNQQRRVRYADDAETEESVLVFSIKPRSQALPPPEPSPNMPFLLDVETDERFILVATNIIIGSSPQHPDFQNNDYLRRIPQRSTQYIMLNGDPDVLPQHCMLCKLGDKRYSIDMMSPHALVLVNQKRIVRKTEIHANAVIQLGPRRLMQLVSPSLNGKNVATMPKERATDMFDKSRAAENPLAVVTNGNYAEQPPPPIPRPDRNSTIIVDGGRRVVAQQVQQQAPPPGAVLPATLEFPDDAAKDLLTFVLHPSNAENPTQFALSPAFTLYLAARYRASTTWHPRMPPMQRANELAQFLFETANTVHETIREVEAALLRPSAAAVNNGELGEDDDDKFVKCQTLAYWLANITELLHFLRNDKHMNTFCVDAQEVLEGTAMMTCHSLARLQQEIIAGCLMPGLEYVQRQNASATSLQTFAKHWVHMVQHLDVIANIMVGCCLNGSLIVQFMSLLFQAINAWCVNAILYRNTARGSNISPLCSYSFGSMLFERINSSEGDLRAWARSKDLHQAVEISFRKLEEVCRVIYELPQLTMSDAGSSSSSLRLRARQLRAYAPSLNSAQLDTLLNGFHAANLTVMDPLPSREFIQEIVHSAAITVDEFIRQAGGAIVVEESTSFGDYPFTMPDAGYGSDDAELGIPNGFLEFLRPLAEANIVVVRPYVRSTSWAIYFHQHHHHIHHQQQQLQHGPPSTVARIQQAQQQHLVPSVINGRPQLPIAHEERRVTRGPVAPYHNGVGDAPHHVHVGNGMMNEISPLTQRPVLLPLLNQRQISHHAVAAVAEPPSPPPPIASRPTQQQQQHRQHQQQLLPVVPPRPPTVPSNGYSVLNTTPVQPAVEPQAAPGDFNGYMQADGPVLAQQQHRRPAANTQTKPIIFVSLQKQPNEGLGIKILSSYDDTYDEPAINGHQNNNDAVKNLRHNARISVTRVEPNSVAYANGQIEKDDILLSVNGMSLNGLTHQQAARAIQSASEAASGCLQFQVEKHG